MKRRDIRVHPFVFSCTKTFSVRKSHIPDHVTCALNTACPMQTDTHVADGCTLCRYSIILNTPRSYTDSSSGLETPLMHVFIRYTHSLLLHVSGIIIFIYITQCMSPVDLVASLFLVIVYVRCCRV